MIGSVPPVPGIEWAETSSADGLTLRATASTGAAGEASLSIRAVAPAESRAELTCAVELHFLDGGIGGAMLDWAESAATALFQRQGRSGQLTLCANTSAPDARSRTLFAAHGLELAVAEDEMRRALSPAIPVVLPRGMIMRPWDEQSAPLFFHAYDSAFRERPGFPNWEESRWRAAFTSSSEFRPDLSTVILDGPEPAAYAIVWVEDTTGWITQMGVRPFWRGKSLGKALIAGALASFAAEGLQSGALEVATNNPNAHALYEQMGFTVASRYESWRKPLN